MLTRSPLFNFLFGAIAGASITVMASAMAIHGITNRSNQDIRELGEIQRAAMQRLTDQAQQTILEHDAAAEQRLQACEGNAATASKSAGMEQWQRDFRDRWYTLVYEPAPANAVPGELELLNMVRPGLGTLLSKLTPPQPPAGAALRYVLHGYVKAEAMPQGVHLVYTLAPPDAAAESQVQ
jgi:hypothetical protein